MKPRARSTKLESARKFAKNKHQHQVRKDGKTPYWYHLRQVVRNLSAIGITDKEILCAGWLHDTIEDTDTDYDDLEEKFGKRVARIVVQVTKDKTLAQREKERKFCEKLSGASWEAQAVKLCDLWANLADLMSGYRKERRLRQVKKTLRYLDAIKSGLAKNSKRIPCLENGVNEINRILKEYRIPVIALH